MGSRFNPWRWLRDDRAQARLHFATVHPSGRGRVEVSPDGTEHIYLDHGLDRRDRNAVLAHEANHLIRGVPPPGCPLALRDREEETVRRLTADGLVPPDELADLVRSRLSVGEGLTATDIADEFDVPAWLAVEAVRLARIRGRDVA